MSLKFEEKLRGVLMYKILMLMLTALCAVPGFAGEKVPAKVAVKAPKLVNLPAKEKRNNAHNKKVTEEGIKNNKLDQLIHEKFLQLEEKWALQEDESRKIEQEYLAELSKHVLSAPYIEEHAFVSAQEEGGCCNCTPIVIDPTGVTTFVISAPGVYKLPSSVNFTPINPNAVAIQVLSNDVTIDLCNHTITQTNATAGTTAILLGNLALQVFRNIRIQNGSIVGFTGVGISANNTSMNTVTPAFFDQIIIQDINILNCGVFGTSFLSSGINFTSNATTNTILLPTYITAYHNVTLRRVNVNSCLGRGAIRVVNVDNLLVEDTNANDLLNNFAGQGVAAWNLRGREIMMFRSQGNRARSLGLTGGAGALPITNGFTLNTYYEDCQFNDSFAESGSAGSNSSKQQNALYVNCQFNNSRCGSDGDFTQGVHMSGFGPPSAASGNKYINCQFNGATGTGRVPPSSFNIVAGVTMFPLANCEFIDCQSVDIFTDNPNWNSYGFLISTWTGNNDDIGSSSRNIKIQNTSVSDLTSPASAAGIFFSAVDASATGVQPALFNIIVEDCTVSRIRGGTSSDKVAGITQGLYSFSNGGFYAKNYNLFLRNNRVSDVRCSGAVSPLSAGIVVESVTQPELLNNSVSDCDRGILLTGSNLINPSNIFQLADSLSDAQSVPPVFVDLVAPLPAAAPLQTFTNLTRGNSISIAPSASTVNLARNYIISTADLNTLGWQLGDLIEYSNNGGGNIDNLVTGTTYYLIVYVPGFSERGLIKENNVSNCSVSGFQDDKTPCTSSVWLSNMAFCNGDQGKNNYEIHFGRKAPVATGNLSCYPEPKTYTQNISITCGKCDCPKNKRHKH